MSGRRPEAHADCLAHLDVLVLAGGLGQRIRSILPDTPKLLAPVAGRPYFAYLLDWLAKFGARRIVLALGYRAAQVLDYLEHRPRSGLAIDTLIESEPLGTAGAVRHARPRLGSDPVLVMNGDSFVDADLCALVARHRGVRALGTLLCTEVDDAARFGRVILDDDGRILRFAEKDAGYRGRATINAGVYALSSALLDTIAAGQDRSLEHDTFSRLPPRTLAALSGRFRFIDIGTPESLSEAGGVLARAGR